MTDTPKPDTSDEAVEIMARICQLGGYPWQAATLRQLRAELTEKQTAAIRAALEAAAEVANSCRLEPKAPPKQLSLVRR